MRSIKTVAGKYRGDITNGYKGLLLILSNFTFGKWNKYLRKLKQIFSVRPAAPGEALCEAWELVEGYELNEYEI